MKPRKSPSLPKQQKGVVLFIALIVLVAMTLAAIGMVRSMDTTTVISGNLAFKQGTIQASDQGVEAAYAWLMSKTTAALNNSSSSDGYYSSMVDPEPNWLDGSTWSGLNRVTLAADGAGNTITYVIHRMCTQPNTAYNGDNAGVANICSQSVAVTSGSTCPGGSKSIGNFCFSGNADGLYYRITTRTVGPRNTSSVVQAMVLIPII